MIKGLLCALVLVASVAFAQKDLFPVPSQNGKPIKKAPPKVLKPDAWRKHVESISGEWKEAAKWMTQQRLFPYDRIPDDAVERAMEHRDALPPARVGMNGNDSTVINGNWSFVGPKNLSVPYRRWWGPAPVSGRVNGAAFDPVVAGRYYIALPNGGVWRTNDFGVSWQFLSTGPSWQSLETSCVAIDPSNNQHILVGLGDHPTNLMWLGSSPGIMRSLDGGNTWNLVGTNLSGRTVTEIEFNPDNTQEVVASLSRGPAQNGGVLRSTTNGATWGAVWTSGLFAGLAVSVPRPDSTRNLYAVADANFMVRSRDFGATWTNVTTPSHPVGAFCQVATSPNFPDRVYLLYSTNMAGTTGSNGAVWRSDDAGGTWVNLTGSGAGGFQPGWWGQSSYNVAIEALKRPWEPNEDLLYVGIIGVHQLGNPEANSGFLWADVGMTTLPGSGANGLTGSPANTHNDQHVLARDPSGFDMLIGNDGGIYRWNFGGFNNLNFNVRASHFYHASFHPTDRNVMIGGTQDNASPTTAAIVGYGDIDNWNNVGGGDGGWTAIDWNDPGIQYVVSQGGPIYRTTDAWTSWNRNTLPNIVGARQDNSTFPFIPVIHMQRTNPKQVWAGSNFRLYRWNQMTGTWTNRVGSWRLDGNGFILAMDTSPSDAGMMLVGALDGEVWLSEQLFESDRFRIDAPATGVRLPDRAVIDFSFHPTNANSFLVALGGFGAPHLYQGTWDPTNNTISWVNVSGTGATGLPDIQVNTVERDPFDPTSTWYVGTDIGVFMTTDGGSTWGNATQPMGLPPVPVNHLQYVPGTGYLNAATWGQGIWRVRLGRPPLLLINLSTLVLRGGLKLTATVALSQAVQEEVPVKLRASNQQIIQMPSSITFAPGETQKSFDIWTIPVGSPQHVTFFAETGGSIVNAMARIDPPDFGLEIFPGELQGPQYALGVVYLESPAPSGMKINLLSSNPTIANPVVSVIDATPGNTSEIFLVETFGVQQEAWVKITANIGNDNRDFWMKVAPLSIESVTLPTRMLRAGTTYTGTVRLRYPSALQSDITLASDNPVCVVPSAVSFAPGQQEATFAVTPTFVGTPQSVVFTASKAFSVATFEATVTAPLIEGQVVRQGLSPNANPSMPVVLEFREPGSTTAFASLTADPDHQGRFSVFAPRVQPFDIAIKDTNWLRAVLGFDGSNPVSLLFSLGNGDVNGDNTVNIGDFLSLRAAFGSSEGAGNWNYKADLNRDGSVNLQDFLILRANFGRTGAP